ncbi:CapA family protein [Halopolyspora algeriensis]|uniref:CapA family protein n=1 Tax=Halopolyspora algeriensis TaxID=1500506 RepID=UPI000DF430A3
MSAGPVTLFLCGDVMPGRGVDQVLPHPGDPSLREAYVRDARTYVQAAEAVNGRIGRPVRFSWPWGVARRVLAETAPEARVINLETGITRSAEFAPNKGVHYRMSPGNVRCVTAGRPDVCVLANNHVLDFGHRGLEDTLAALSGAGLHWAGAGRDVGESRQPAIVPAKRGGRVVVFAGGVPSSGIPANWAAGVERPGIHVLPDLSEATATAFLEQVRAVKQPGDIVIASLHWGTNWGYHVSDDEIGFAHRLLDGDVDVVHGHSSHHPRPIEMYRDKLVLYGCGDFIDDYEGIAGHEEYRDDLRLLYFPSVEPDTGSLLGLRMVPVQARRMRLHPVAGPDAEWLHSVLARISRPFGAGVGLEPGGTLVLRRD